MKELITTLYQYGEWANARLLAKAGALTPAELGQRFSKGAEPILPTFGHLVGADVRWLARWRGGGRGGCGRGAGGGAGGAGASPRGVGRGGGGRGRPGFGPGGGLGAGAPPAPPLRAAPPSALPRGARGRAVGAGDPAARLYNP